MTFVDLDPDQGGPRADLWCAMTDPRWLSFGTQRRINKALMILHAVTVQRRPMLDDELWALDALYDLVNQHVRSWNLPSADGALDGSDAVAPIWPPLSDMPEKPIAPVHGPKVPKTERASIDALHAEMVRLHVEHRADTGCTTGTPRSCSNRSMTSITCQPDPSR